VSKKKIMPDCKLATRRNVGAAKGHNMHNNFRERQEGAKIGMIEPMCRPVYHNWNNFCGIVVELTMGKIALFVTPQVQIFNHILKYF